MQLKYSAQKNRLTKLKLKSSRYKTWQRHQASLFHYNTKFFLKIPLFRTFLCRFHCHARLKEEILALKTAPDVIFFAYAGEHLGKIANLFLARLVDTGKQGLYYEAIKDGAYGIKQALRPGFSQIWQIYPSLVSASQLFAL